MGSEKTRIGGALVPFATAEAACRRVAGVAAAARIARALVEAGHDPVWIAVPGGGPLPPQAMADVQRLADGATVAVADSLALERAGIGPEDLAELTIVAPPRLREWEIVRATAKTGDGPVAKWINRPVSQSISVLLLRIPGVRPIHATFGTALLALAMFAALALGGAGGIVAGALLFQAASIFDGVDGEIARATYRSSPAGAALDTGVDMATNLAFVLGVTINLGLSGGREAVLVGGWGLLLFAAGLILIIRHAAHTGGSFNLDQLKHRYRGLFSSPFASGLISFGAAVSSRDFFALLFALLIVAGAPMGVPYIFAVAATIWIVLVVAAVAPTRHTGRTRERSA